MDSAYLSKVDLQSKADTLLEEVDFLKYLFQSVSEYLKYFYEMMSSVLIRNLSLFYICQGVWDVRGGKSDTQPYPLGVPLPSHLKSAGLESESFQPPKLRIPGGALEMGGAGTSRAEGAGIGVWIHLKVDLKADWN